MYKRFWRVETGLFLAIWLVLMVGGRSRLFRDPGTFWHTVVGARIMAGRAFPDTDSFSYTFAGATWIPHQWLGECTMAAIHRLDGLDSLLLATATALAALFTWTASRLLHAGLHWSLTAALVMLAVGASAAHFHVRPHVGTMIFLGCTFALLCDFEAGRIGTGRLFWLVPLFIVWSNVHGGMLGGLGTLLLAVAYWSFSAWLGREGPVRNKRDLAALALLIGLCGLSAFVNPYGPRLPRTWLEIMDSPILPEIIIEHAPLNASRPDGWLVLLFGGVYGLIALGLRPRWPRVTWLLPLLWFYLACSRVRHAPLFAITAILAMAEMLPRTRWAAWLARPGRDLFQSPAEGAGRTSAWPDWRPALLPASVILLAVVLQWGGVRVPVVGHDWARLDAAYWPMELLPELRAEERRQPSGTHIFNEYLYGGFLIYHTPRLQVFVDDRCELYGDAWLLEFVQAEWQNTGPRIEQLQRGHGNFALALTRTGSGYDRYFRGDGAWSVVKETATATLYRRQSAAAARADVRSALAAERHVADDEVRR